MQRQKRTPLLDLRGAACPMAFVKAKLHLDTLSPGETTRILFEQTPANEPLVRSICSLGHQVLLEKTGDAETLNLNEQVTASPPVSDTVQLTILEIEVKM